MSQDEYHGGGVNRERSFRHEFLENVKLQRLSDTMVSSQVHRIFPDPDDRQRFHATGRGFSPTSQVYVDGVYCKSRFIHDGEIEFIRPNGLQPHASVMITDSPPVSLRDPSITRLSITGFDVLTDLPLRTGQTFAISVTFEPDFKAVVRLLSFTASFPDGQQNSQHYLLTDEESKAGRKIIEGFSVGSGGWFEVHATLYDDDGNADYKEQIFQVVPSNPVQLYVYPQHNSSGTSKGAAIYQSSDDRYYCHARFVVSNGNSYAVMVGPNVRCRVSDAGLGELAHFNFSIGTTTIPANSTRTLYIHTYHGGGTDVYDLFRDFNDAKYEFWLQTSAGEKYDWNVWVAMAHVGVTANFVGDFSWAEMLKVRDIIDTYATGIYSKVDCIFRLNTPILEIPRSHGDWGRYRDIHVEENKDGNCVDSDEADDLRDDWSAPSEYDDCIDLFFVESFSGDACASSLGGFSPVDGPSGKGGDNSGIVIDVNDMNILSSSWGEQVLGVIIAHEVGHFLDLEHSTLTNNFMRASVGTGETAITYDQWKEMRDHFFVRRHNP